MQGYAYSVFLIAAIAIHLILNFNLLLGRGVKTVRGTRYRGFLAGVLFYLLDLAKMDAGKITLHSEPMHLARLTDDFVFSDFWMPNMNGLELIEAPCRRQVQRPPRIRGDGRHRVRWRCQAQAFQRHHPQADNGREDSVAASIAVCR